LDLRKRKIKEDGWRKLHTKEFNNFYSSMKVIKVGGDGRDGMQVVIINAYKILTTEVEGKTHLGRSECR
jgi:D-serine dehydratase